MGGFAALIGGLGQGAQAYGNQVRGFLENRRTGIANQLLQEAGRTWDPEHRSNLLKGVTDLMSNVPMDKALTPVLKSYQTHEQGTQWHAQLGQAVQQAMPQPGPPQPGPAAVGQQPGTTLPADITAALPPLSPVAPEAQGGGGPTPAPFTQGLAPNSPLAPPAQEAPPLAAAIGQPAQPSAAPSAGPIPQAAGPQAFGQPYDPLGLGYTQQAFEFLKGLPPGAREGLAPEVLQGAEANRQLGIAYVQMGWRRQQAEPAMAEMDQVLNNPDSSLLERMAARSAKMQAYEWIAGGGAAPAFPLTASTMLRAQEATLHVEDASPNGMSEAERQQKGIGPEIQGPVYVAYDRYGNPLGYRGMAPARMAIGTIIDQAGNIIGTGTYEPQRPGAGVTKVQGIAPPGFTGFMQGTTGTGQIGVIPKAALLGPQGWQNAFQAMRTTPFVNPAFATTERRTSTAQTEAGTETATTARKTFGQTPPPASLTAVGGAGGGRGTPGVDPSQVQAAVAQVTRPNLSIAESKALEEKLGVSSAGALAKTPFARAYRQAIRQKAIDDPNDLITWDAPIAAMAQRSTQTLDEIARVKNLITRMQQNGELGLVMTRWNAFWTNRLGKDLSENHDYVALANGLGLINTAMGFVHGGARGGGSIQMRNAFAEHLNADKMDAGTLLGALSEEENWLRNYANPSLTALGAVFPKGVSGSITPAGPVTPAGPSGGARPSLESFHR